MPVKKGLGRGFESLIPTDLLDESFDPTAAQDEQISDLRNIKLDQIITDPNQPRRQFDEVALAELAASITEHGVLQPIVVSPYKKGYQIVAGERRYRAAKIAGLDKIPALVRTLNGQHKLELSLIENLQRSDLNPIETAMAYLKLRDQFNLTLEEIGRRVGKKSVSAISNALRLLKLPKSARLAVVEGQLTEGQARPLIMLDKETINTLVPKIIREGWSARKIEQYVVALKGNKQRKTQPEIIRTLTTDEERWTKRYGSKVEIQVNTRGAGKIVLRFKNQKEFNRLKELLD
ncbi:MAG: ParB/RepB/Spo0J family partition protein [Candidatus Paceibacterota bacterium]